MHCLDSSLYAWRPSFETNPSLITDNQFKTKEQSKLSQIGSPFVELSHIGRFGSHVHPSFVVVHARLRV